MKPTNFAIPHRQFRRAALRWLGGFLAVVVCLPLLSGCNKGTPAGKGTVTGKVTIGGKVVGPAAFVAFHGADGKQVGQGVTDNESTYNVQNIPVGTVKIAVTRPTSPGGAPPPGMDKSMPGAASSAALPIPAKYAKPDNGLTYTVAEGKQRHDIDLTP